MIKSALIVAFAVACMAFLPTGSFAAGSDRVVLHGNVNPRANPAFDQGTSDPSLAMNQRILLLKMDPQKQAQLDRLVADQQDSSSSSFHKWLTPAQFGQRFGRTPEEIATVTNWLVSQGFTIDSVSKSGTMITFSGTVAAVNRAFDANMHDYQVNGHLRHANSVDPSIPSALANLVAGPVSLSTSPESPRTAPDARFRSGAQRQAIRFPAGAPAIFPRATIFPRVTLRPSTMSITSTAWGTPAAA